MPFCREASARAVDKKKESFSANGCGIQGGGGRRRGDAHVVFVGVVFLVLSLVCCSVCFRKNTGSIDRTRLRMKYIYIYTPAR